MKRFHVHVSVDDLAQSVQFYSTLFARQPSFVETDYAKWMLADPPVNFAISKRRQSVGVNHLGFQVDSGEDLEALRSQLLAADSRVTQESNQACCYARSDKYWVTDPSGIAWETFRTLSRIPIYGEDTPIVDHGISQGCCLPKAKAQADTGDGTS